ncbi:MAG: class I SAM-dependent methyltransferase [Pseudomonadota bacterium]
MDTADFWDKAAEKYAKSKIRDMAGYEETLGRMKALLRPQDSVVEIGCGTGSTALELAGSVASYTGTDISPKMIEIAKSKQGPSTPQNLQFEVTKADASLPQGTSVVLALNLLHLLPDLDATLNHLHNSLPPSGRLIAKTVLLKEGAWYISMLLPLLKAIGKAPPIVRLSQSDVMKALETAGFEVSETIHQGGAVPRLFTVASKK